MSDTSRSAGNTGDSAVPLGHGTASQKLGPLYGVGGSGGAGRSLRDDYTAPIPNVRRVSIPVRRVVDAAEAAQAKHMEAYSSESKMDRDLSVHAADVVDLVLERHRKYGPRNIAGSPGGAIAGIAVRLHDKVARLGHSQSDFGDESLADTLRDIVGYGLIALLCINGQWPDA